MAKAQPGGDVLPHGCIGGARRILVGERGSLARVMLEAVQNHGPAAVVVDEIANKQEVEAARTIAARGVMLVATAHGTGLASLLRNPELNPLVGGLQTVTLGDAEARRTQHGVKSRTERRGAPTFRTLVEVLGGGRLRLRPDVAASVDSLLGLPGAAAAAADASEPAPPPPPHPPHQRWPSAQQPGSLRIRGAAAAAALQAAAAAVHHLPTAATPQAAPAAEEHRWEVLPPLEQLRWVESKPEEDAVREVWEAFYEWEVFYEVFSVR
ncbi:hypothetical protein GPECTOR_318g19 [Gonium pectorale]|uniref:SecA family profile domain-containing protein n=1 Tax=Gonium pectorale TaxID=33097 RepID=A0A150FVP9_GONPE|nr:hypothetical protein GPECTOR_318g19 [Gonium pectorale]|eukprot:KXZ41692.1 hypothetical protein GPECTOR_318g19 [Gonium pectorale]